MTDDWRPMEDAYRDGRHLILRLRETEDWSAYAKLPRWAGGVLGYWNSDDDQWTVVYEPEDFGCGGGVEAFDSHWFTGWKNLPDALYEAEAA